MKKILTLTSFLLCINLVLLSQVIPANWQVKVSYDKTQTTQFVFPEGADVQAYKAIDLARFKQSRHTEEVEQYIDQNDDLITQIQRLEPDKSMANWMTQPTRTLIDRRAVYQYDEQNTLIRSIPHDTSYLIAAATKKIFRDITTFGISQPVLIPDPTEIVDWQNQGYTVIIQSDGKAFITNEEREIIIDSQTSKVSITQLRNGQPSIELNRYFRTNSQGYWVPSLQETRFFEMTADSLCYEKRKTEVFTNYSVQQNFGELLTENNDHQIDAVRIYPNPVHNWLNVEMPTTDIPKQIELLDLRGRLLWQRTLSPEVSFYQIPLQSLISGTYIFQLKTSLDTQTFKFVKQ